MGALLRQRPPLCIVQPRYWGVFVVAMCYEDVTRWSQSLDLLMNRVGILNQILGCKYDQAPDNPLRLVCVRRSYVCEVCGCAFVRFRLYDIDGLESAISALDSFVEGLWLLNRTGRLSFT